ncbi:hypothetical protein HOK51_03000 [Candidatus Woesearchaeota archaeon]|jgi:hypothetical protein|nr:hypothetical protein [Candidatus Woesearchaeota archaeon]MBT6518786.1 hypothetical protein [Candidatus Woesearchaeota archaeon]MBT7367925.1 hypothetical protein [Candidatus Woesearchaeota archaeon]
MVSAKDKNRMVQVLTDLLENSGTYSIKQSDNEKILVVEKKEIRENPRKIFVMSHAKKRTKSEINGQISHNQKNNIYTAHAFFKHEEDDISFVRMVKKNKGWRQDKSLKKYSEQDINRMIHLRGIEKWILCDFYQLTYYQKESTRLEECVKTYKLNKVTFDRTHLRPGDPGYGFAAMHEESKDYKLPELTELISGAAGFKYLKNQNPLYRAWIFKTEAKPTAVVDTSPRQGNLL